MVPEMIRSTSTYLRIPVSPEQLHPSAATTEECDRNICAIDKPTIHTAEMDSAPSQAAEPAPEYSRPAKRMKFYRKRHEAEDDEDSASTPPAAPAPIVSPELMTVDELIEHGGQLPPLPDEPQLSIQDILRQRKAAQRRKGGIEFTNRSAESPVPEASNALVVKEAEDEVPADIKDVTSRFAPQTGQVTDDTDKHMYDVPSSPPIYPDTGTATNVARRAYIDSQMAKLHNQDKSRAMTNASTSTNGQPLSKLPDSKQPAALGKLHEIDLGADATARNIALTEAAQRRLDGQPDEEELPRLRRDGKPFRRKRRTSTDIKRDRLVEEVMRESRLEIYDDEPGDEGDGGEGEADDRIAEQFRREFLDAVSSRRQRAPAAATRGKDGKKVEEAPRGPKLGGSRSARAKVREREMEEAAAKGKRR